MPDEVLPEPTHTSTVERSVVVNPDLAPSIKPYQYTRPERRSQAPVKPAPAKIYVPAVPTRVVDHDDVADTVADVTAIMLINEMAQDHTPVTEIPVNWTPTPIETFEQPASREVPTPSYEPTYSPPAYEAPVETSRSYDTGYTPSYDPSPSTPSYDSTPSFDSSPSTSFDSNY